MITPRTLAETVALSFKAFVTTLIHGPSAVGKTTIIKKIARDPHEFYQKLRELVWGSPEPVGFINLRAAQIEPTDLGGLPYLENGITKYAAPEFMPSLSNKALGHNGILCLDEFFRTGEATIQAMFELVEPCFDPTTKVRCHKVGSNYLPPGWHVVALTNPMGSENFVQNQIFDRALFNRFAHLWFSPAGIIDEYCTEWNDIMIERMSEDYGEDSLGGYAENVFGMVNDIGHDLLFGVALQEQTSFGGMVVSPSPAGWEKVLHVLCNYENCKGTISQEAMEVLVRGIVGDTAFGAFKAATLPISPMEIIRSGRAYWDDLLNDSETPIDASTVTVITAVLSGYLQQLAQEENTPAKHDKIYNLFEFVVGILQKHEDVDSKGRRYEVRDLVGRIVSDAIKLDVKKLAGPDGKPLPVDRIVKHMIGNSYEHVLDMWKNFMEPEVYTNSFIYVLGEALEGSKDHPHYDVVKEIVTKSVVARAWVDTKIKELGEEDSAETKQLIEEARKKREQAKTEQADTTPEAAAS